MRALLLAGAALGCVALRDSAALAVTRRRLALSRFPALPRLRVAHLSDFHASHEVPLSRIRRAVELVVAEKPDLIVLLTSTA